MEESSQVSNQSTFSQVVDRGICVGCGACAVRTDGRVSVELRPRGYYSADISGVEPEVIARAAQVCPFADESRNEDQIADDLFPDLPRDSRIGSYRSLFAGQISSENDLPLSSSGGLTTWIVSRLLAQGLVDGVIHVGSNDQPMFGYTVSYTLDEVLAARKSKYFPASFADVLRDVRGDGRKYAFVGVPCATRAVRLLAEQDALLATQISFVIGIVCGHLKSAAYAESLAWQLGIEPDRLKTVDFRIKDPNRSSRGYRFGADSVDGQHVEAPTSDLVGGNWGHAVFQLDACNYCDDVFAETADVAVGDCWLPKYESDWRGTNVVVTRNAVIDELLRDGRASGELTWDALDADSVARTQAGNFRHRREGLAVRLADDAVAGRWSPRKRVTPGYDLVSPERVDLIRKRRRLSALSHGLFASAKEAGDVAIYLDGARNLIEAYGASARVGLATRVKNRIIREYWKRLPGRR